MGKFKSTHDIAKALGISASTVSRALNDHYSISSKTKLRVIAYAQKIGFQKNLNASQLISKKTYTVGFVVPEITSHFFSTICQGIKNILDPKDYDLLIMNSGESYEKEVKIIKHLLSIRVDAIIFIPTNHGNNYDHLIPIFKNKVPFVNIDRAIIGMDCHKVLIDNKQGAFLATQHLIDIGCKNIAHLAGPENTRNSANRLEGFKSALAAHGLQSDDSLIFFTDFRVENSRQVINQVFDRKDRPDGIFTVNDELGIGCLHRAIELNITVPDQLAIIGFDNEFYSKYFNPALSTIDSPIKEMGKKSASVCLRLIEEYDLHQPKSQILKPKLIIRKSSRRGNPRHFA
ncbi:MAG: LacI family DNA-binding transcriptional regulator [Cyclobacteriaceae bacterium]